MDAGIQLSLAHEMPMFAFPGSSWDQIQTMGSSGAESRPRHACDFGIFFAQTPKCLLTRNIYNNIAIPLKGGEWRGVSLKMFMKQFSGEADVPRLDHMETQLMKKQLTWLDRQNTRRSCGGSSPMSPAGSGWTVAKLVTSPVRTRPSVTSGEVSPTATHRNWGQFFTPLRSGKRLRTPEGGTRRQSVGPPVRLRSMKTFTRLVPRPRRPSKSQLSGGEVPPSAHVIFSGVGESGDCEAATRVMPQASHAPLASELCVHTAPSGTTDVCTPDSINLRSYLSPSPLGPLPRRRGTRGPVHPLEVTVAGQQRVQAALLSAQQRSPNLVVP